ncbi:hypothetical protein [Aquisphaera insulae]|uniref:hypothetical protein n=1 Tax=Aquisphaera insulae TaxID=2712864 RepID=UPI0013EA2613|nr:hypothetical protein [Aquisphaera insulae]
MISDARIQANRRNAGKSTGPRTEAGKMVSRLNGLVHGRRSKILSMPVLPQENPKDLERLVADFVRDGRPASAMEKSLLVRAARLTWMLDRSDRAESAHLAEAVRARANPRPDRSEASEARSRRVRDLGAQLFYPLSPREDRDPDWQDDPASCIAGLEETREGCRWLLEQWRSIRAYLVAGKELLIGDFYRFVRLHGRKVADHFWDLDLNAALAAADVAWDGAGRAIYERFLRGLRAEDFLTFEQGRQWRTFAAPPATKEEALAWLLADAEAHMDRLAALLGDDADDDENADPADRDDAAAFAAERELDRHRRTVAARTRELMQTLEMLRKLQKARGVSGMAWRDPAEPEPLPEPGATIEAELPSLSCGASPLMPSPPRGGGLGRGGGWSEPSIEGTAENPDDPDLIGARSCVISDHPLSLTLPHVGGRGPDGGSPELFSPLPGGDSGGDCEISDEPATGSAASPVEADRWEPAPIVIAEDAHEPLPEDVRNPMRPEPATEPEEAPSPQTVEEMRGWGRANQEAHERSERTQGLTAGREEIAKFIDLLTINLDAPIGRGPDHRRLPRRE